MKRMRKLISLSLAAALMLTFAMPSMTASATSALPELKILCIGHSYAWDSMEYLNTIAKSQGVDLTVGLAYRGNCSVKDHSIYFDENILYGTDGNKGFYLKYDRKNPDGNTIETMTLKEIIKDEKWDIIIFQECLDYAGCYYEETSQYLPELVEKVMGYSKNKHPELWWHQLWALEKPEAVPLGEGAVFFGKYDNDQQKMYEMVKESAQKAAEELKGNVIPTGDAFQLVRSHKEFDTLNGGQTLMRDNVANHSNDYGKYLAALVWYQTLTKCKLDTSKLRFPRLTDEKLMNIIVSCSTEAVEGRGTVLKSVEEAFAEREASRKADTSDDESGAESGSGEKNGGALPFIIAGAAVLLAVIAAVVVILIKKRS